MIRGSPEQWAGSNCVGKPGDLFFPVKGETPQRQAREATSVCWGTDDYAHLGVCPNQAMCLEWAFTGNQRWGVWGGYSEPQRARLRRARQQQEREDLELLEASFNLLPIIPAEPIYTPLMLTLENQMAPKKPLRKPSGDLARFGNARKSGTLLGEIERYLLAQPQDVGRHHDLIHVSELAKPDFCPRAAYRRIRNARRGIFPVIPAPHFELDKIFAEGDQIHDKYKGWLRGMGVLWGQYLCYGCNHEWFDTSPKTCPQCNLGYHCLGYREVPMQDEQHLLVANSDGEYRSASDGKLIEIKSLSVGTVRVELPGMLNTYTRKYRDEDGKDRSYLDHDALWRDLHTPFPSHLRQGHLYLHTRKCMEYRYDWPAVEELIFIYEYKPTQSTKQFRIRYDAEAVAPLLELCKDVRWGLEYDVPPTCVKGRRQKCAACTAYEAHIRDTDTEDDDGTAEQPTPAAHGDSPARTGTGGAASAIRAATAEGSPRTPRRLNRPARRGADGAAGAPHSLGGLLGRAVGDGGR